MLKQINDNLNSPNYTPFKGMSMFSTPSYTPTTDFSTMFQMTHELFEKPKPNKTREQASTSSSTPKPLVLPTWDYQPTLSSAKPSQLMDIIL